MFKVGDKIQCIPGQEIHESNHNIEKGKIYTVDMVVEINYGQIDYGLYLKEGGKNFCYYANRFKPAKIIRNIPTEPI